MRSHLAQFCSMRRVCLPEVSSALAESKVPTCHERDRVEQLGVRPRVGRLLWIIESFFALEGKRYHEFGLYFLIALPASIPTTVEFEAFDPHYRLIRQGLP